MHLVLFDTKCTLLMKFICFQLELLTLYEIAKASEGGMRDALSLLDQAISYSTEKVSLEDVLSITGAVSQAFIVKIVQAIFNENIVEALDSVESLIKNGKDPARFVEDLIFYYRDVLLYQAS